MFRIFNKNKKEKPLSYSEYMRENAIQLSNEIHYGYFSYDVIKKYIMYLQFFGVEINGKFGRKCDFEYQGGNEEFFIVNIHHPGAYPIKKIDDIVLFLNEEINKQF